MKVRFDFREASAANGSRCRCIDQVIPSSERILRFPPISGLSIDAATSYSALGYLEPVFRLCTSN